MTTRNVVLYMLSRRQSPAVREAVLAYRGAQLAGRCIDCDYPAAGDPADLTHAPNCTALNRLEQIFKVYGLRLADVGRGVITLRRGLR